MGFVFQAFHLLPRLTAAENVALPLFYRGEARDERRRRSLQALERVGMAARADHRPDELSGGERQRAAIARALVGEPRLILADEPTGALDSVTAGEVIGRLVALNRELGVTVVIVTHDAPVAARCPRRIRLLDGVVVADVRRDVRPAAE
jgi:putative ABC transport system ATP-binding protein